MDVHLYVYDISKGLARTMSQSLLGRQIDGIWHTSIVVFGKEYFFGSFGIDHCPPRGTILGPPDSVVTLGQTALPEDVFNDYITGLRQDAFSGGRYHLLEHNCNTFTSELAQFLTGNDIPQNIRNLSQDVLNTPFGAAIRPLLDSMSISASVASSGQQQHQQPPHPPPPTASPPARQGTADISSSPDQRISSSPPPASATTAGTNCTDSVARDTGEVAKSSTSVASPNSATTTHTQQQQEQQQQQEGGGECQDTMASAQSDPAAPAAPAPATDDSAPAAAATSQPQGAGAEGAAPQGVAAAPQGAEAAPPQGAEAAPPQGAAASPEGAGAGVDDDDELMARAAALISKPSKPSGPRHKDFTPDGVKYEPKGGGPVFYLDVDYSAHYQALRQGAMSVMCEEELHLLDELHEYLSNEDSIWSVSQEHMALIGKLLLGEGLSPSIHLHVLRLLQLAVINFDVVLMLKHDKENKFMTYVYNFDSYDKEIQIELGKVLCNVCSNKTGVNWLLNIIVDYHLTDVTSQPNGLVITKIAVNMLLSDDLSVVEVGANLCLHFAVYQITYYNESSVDISFALLQCLSKDLPEPIAYHCLAALFGFLNVTAEVGEIIQIVGTDLSSHAKKSDRLMSAYEAICQKLNIPP